MPSVSLGFIISNIQSSSQMLFFRGELDLIHEPRAKGSEKEAFS